MTMTEKKYRCTLNSLNSLAKTESEGTIKMTYDQNMRQMRRPPYARHKKRDTITFKRCMRDKPKGAEEKHGTVSDMGPTSTPLLSLSLDELYK